MIWWYIAPRSFTIAPAQQHDLAPKWLPSGNYVKHWLLTFASMPNTRVCLSPVPHEHSDRCNRVSILFVYFASNQIHPDESPKIPRFMKQILGLKLIAFPDIVHVFRWNILKQNLLTTSSWKINKGLFQWNNKFIKQWHIHYLHLFNKNAPRQY